MPLTREDGTVAPPLDESRLELTDLGSGTVVPVRARRLIIAGYTGRDQDAVRAHIEELAAIGVPAPPRTPMFYDIPARLVTTAPAIQVAGEQTSGEIEPVLIRAAGKTYLGLGSDHTDRQVERHDIAQSKSSAPKPLAQGVIDFEEVAARWDDIALSCRVDGELYQRGTAAALLRPDSLLERLAADSRPLRDGELMFCGTLPLLAGGFVYGVTYELELSLPDGRMLAHTYQVRR